MKRFRVALGVALATVILLAVFAPAKPDEGTALATASGPRNEKREAPSTTGAAAPPRLSIRPIARAELVHPSASPGTDLFAAHSWEPPALPTPMIIATPVVPALPFTFLGKKRESGIWEIYLDDSGRLLTIHKDDLIEGTYKVISIEPPLLKLLYVPLGAEQTLPIGDPE